MVVSDPIADFLTRIRNAQMARRSEVRMPYSQLKHRVAEVMQKNDFLASVEKDESGQFPVLVLGLPEKTLTLQKVSRPGQRIYTPATEIRKVKNGFGIAIISTPKGVMTGYEARSLHVGGEFLCTVS
ncbi:30S ribosomal protein S8 [Candidatus Peribacteria bacterium]|nr:30S ribosomal protein S8 [Candidatus Peribacteria bacterium]